MTQYDNSNRGVLFANERKTRPNQPDFTGNVELSRELLAFLASELSAGREPKLAISGWSKVGKSGKKFLSLSVDKPYRPEGAASAAASRPKSSEDSYDINDDIPF